MLRLLSRRLSELSDQSQVPSRFASPEIAPEPMSVGGAGDGPFSEVPAMDGQNLFDLNHVPPGLFDTDLDVGFNLDGFWEDFTLTDNGGFPFR